MESSEELWEDIAAGIVDGVVRRDWPGVTREDCWL